MQRYVNRVKSPYHIQRAQISSLLDHSKRRLDVYALTDKAPPTLKHQTSKSTLNRFCNQRA